MEKKKLPTPTAKEREAMNVVAGFMAIAGGGILSAYEDGKVSFIFYPFGRNGPLASGRKHEAQATDAWDRMVEAYEAMLLAPPPITSAAMAVEVIRERIANGEDAVAVLDDIKVA